MIASTYDMSASVLCHTDAARQAINRNDALPKKQKLEQFFSSADLARMMASMMDYSRQHIHILDPGAGTGSLFAACVDRICDEYAPESVEVTAYEIDDGLFGRINDALSLARQVCRHSGIRFSGRLLPVDFIDDFVSGGIDWRPTHVIMNPPYRKIRTSSSEYSALKGVGLQTTNMYSAFVSVSHNLLESGGQMVFISPRSFCNGTYFAPFRMSFLESMTVRSIHLFDSRTSSFCDDGVLQENIIMHAEKHGRDSAVTISSSTGPGTRTHKRRVPASDVVFADDSLRFIHIVPDAIGDMVSEAIRGLPCSLDDLGIAVSTGKVVDFRARGHLRFEDDGCRTVPLVRPFNVSDTGISFPVPHRKHHNFIVSNSDSRDLLVRNGHYVVVKRFTAKEERRRIVAAVWERNRHRSDLVGFENRINYFHHEGGPLRPAMAAGLRAYLNSSALDEYFRQFNGSTQVNATDLRYIRYPSPAKLTKVGCLVKYVHDHDRVDGIVQRTLFGKRLIGT